MDELIYHGMILKTSPIGEFDRRLVLLTQERGKLTAFAKGAGRPGSRLLGRTRPMVFGEFRLYPGKDAYRFIGAEITNYFDELSTDFSSVVYASYFMELADYYGREGVDGKDTLNLMYLSFQALKKKVIPETLVRCVFELRLLTINGEYPIPEQQQVSDTAVYTMNYIISSPLEELYRFTVKKEVERELREVLDRHIELVIGKKFQSLALLEQN